MGLNLFSRILGDGDEHLVILHGLLGSSDNWQTLGKRYAEHFTVHLVDARNHGRSPHSSEHSYSLMAEDLLHYLNEKNVRKCTVLFDSVCVCVSSIELFTVFHQSMSYSNHRLIRSCVV